MKKWYEQHEYEIECVLILLGVTVYFAMLCYCW